MRRLPPSRRVSSCAANEGSRYGAWLAIVVTLAAATGVDARQDREPPAAASAAENARCLECHGQPHLAELPLRDLLPMVQPTGDVVESAEALEATRPDLYVGTDPLGGGLHDGLRCTDCHADVGTLPHPRTLEPVSCARSCHRAARVAFERGSHAEALARGAADAPTCTTCHGTHAILPSSDADSLTHPFNTVRVCADCHRQHATLPNGTVEAEAHVLAYLDSVHGKAITAGGLTVAATCSDCHGHHEIYHATDPAAPTNRENIPTTCGLCHLGVVEVYADSVHGRKLTEGDEWAPVCTDCHAGHRITHASTPEHRLDIVTECGDCHDRPGMAGDRRATFYKTYRASYHGQVTALGSARAARCSDCHGTHDILPIDDPASRLYGDNRIETCRSCHEHADASLALFDPHADYRDGDRYPLLHGVWWYFIVIMSAAFGFFGLHSILWFIRSVIERRRSGAVAHANGSTNGIRRFTVLNRINHAIVIITFFGLTLTGIPLLFSDHEWAKQIASVVGGVHLAGRWHRIFAVMLMGNFVIHVYGLVRAAAQRRDRSLRGWLFGTHSLMPKLKDVRDCGGMIRWFFRGGRPPSFGRWTYWEKFDYWAEIAGTLIIGGSGLLLWFPIFFAQFMPGWIFNVAMIVHGYEALLALGFIFTIHFFNAHLRPEKFPVDDVIFTGQVPEAVFREERSEEYDELMRTGQLDEFRVPAVPRWHRVATIVIGVAATTIGMSLVALIIVAGLSAL